MKLLSNIIKCCESVDIKVIDVTMINKLSNLEASLKFFYSFFNKSLHFFKSNNVYSFNNIYSHIEKLPCVELRWYNARYLQNCQTNL